MNRALAIHIDALLPQTQCTRCGYAGCRPYAEAIAAGESEINHCPPGGEEGIARLAALLDRGRVAPDPANGSWPGPTVARIDEAACIGCTKCIAACPVDAIVGAPKRMHTVIASWCTGCELCLPPCPVDCIVMDPTAALPAQDLSRARHETRAVRVEREAASRDARLASLE
jgi:electron transport complex protein RnfB